MPEYIDRANLIARIKYYVTHTPEDSGEHYAYSVVLNEVLNCPAADVVPVVHGKWEVIHVKNHWDKARCSACKRVFESYEWGSNYCPVCGAKMDGGADNGTD